MSRRESLAKLGEMGATLAHEIRNPLAAIKGMSQSIERGINDPEFVKDFSEVVPKEIDRLNNLVENLVRLGRTPRPQLIPVKVNEVIESVLKLFDNRCRNKGIAVSKELNPLPEIEADPEQLTQVFTNLILNAIQAMPNGGELRINSRRAEDKTVIELADTGQGILEENLKTIFEPFFSTKDEGTGLGLAITYKIIKDFGGDIEVESEVGRGTKFIIRLPV